MKTSIRLLAIISSLLIINFFSFGQTDTITILHVNDTHSNLAPIGPRNLSLEGTLGGIARAASVIGMTKMTDPNVLLLHAGDLFIGDLFFNVYFGVAELQIMNALGFDAMVLGNHEFDLTPAVLQQALDSGFVAGGFPIVSSNLYIEDSSVQSLKKYIKPFTIKEFGKVKVGIFGLTTPETNILSQPSPAFLDTNFIQIAGAMVDTLTKKNCDVIICLSHLGKDLDKTVASYVPGIDVIVGGHDHYLLTEPEIIINPSGGKTYIVQAGAFYLDIGKLRLTVNGGKVNLLDYQIIPLDQSIPEEPSIVSTISSLIQGIETTYGPMYTQKVSYASKDFKEVADSLLHRGYKDTPIGNLVTDAFRAFTKTDIAIEVGGSTAQPLYRGPIVGDDLFRTVGYGFNTDNGLGYRLATFEMSGVVLLMGLEFGLSNIEQNDEFLIQISGLKYIYDPTQKPFERLKSAEINGNPINPSKIYTVTANEFVPLFLAAKNLPIDNVHIFTDTTEFQILYAYVSQLDTIKPKVEGRIICDPPPVGVLKKNDLPNRFILHQNYPNPFNPSTTISFEIPRYSYVTIKIYNLLGQEVKTLLNDILDAGRHEIVLNANNLAGGVYFYTLRTNDFIQTKKLILLK